MPSVLLLLAFALLGCAPATTGTGDGAEPDDAELVELAGRTVAGPTGPPTIEDESGGTEPVEGAVVEVLDLDGAHVATATSAADGTFSVEVAAGEYELRARPVDGLMGTPGRVTVTAPDDAPVELVYDTGIR